MSPQSLHKFRAAALNRLTAMSNSAEVGFDLKPFDWSPPNSSGSTSSSISIISSSYASSSGRSTYPRKKGVRKLQRAHGMVRLIGSLFASDASRPFGSNSRCSAATSGEVMYEIVSSVASLHTNLLSNIKTPARCGWYSSIDSVSTFVHPSGASSAISSSKPWITMPPARQTLPGRHFSVPTTSKQERKVRMGPRTSGQTRIFTSEDIDKIHIHIHERCGCWKAPLGPTLQVPCSQQILVPAWYSENFWARCSCRPRQTHGRCHAVPSLQPCEKAGLKRQRSYPGASQH